MTLSWRGPAGGVAPECSTTSALGGGETFTGTKVKVESFSSVTVFVDTDVDGTLYGEFSVDGTNWDRVSQIDVTVDEATGGAFSFDVVAQWFRVRYVNGASAQSHVRLQTLLHNARPAQRNSFPDEMVSAANSVGLVRVVNNAWADYSRNLYADRKIVNKFGTDQAVPNAAFAEVWSKSTTPYPWPTAAETVRVQAGGNAADTAAGDGARKVIIFGLDENFDEASEEVDLDGESASAATTVTFTRVFRAYVSECGTYGGANVGDINIENTTSTNILAFIDAELGQTLMTQYTIPTGYTGYLRAVSINVSGTNTATIRLFRRTNADDISAPVAPNRLMDQWSKSQGSTNERYDCMPALSEKSDIWFEASGQGATEVDCGFELLLVRGDAAPAPQ